MHGCALASVSSPDRALLRCLQDRAIGYFLDNQAPDGLVQDRQANHGPSREDDRMSICATGMGLIAIALASAEPHRLIDRAEAVSRVRSALQTGLERLPHDNGIFPHFVDRRTLAPMGEDAFSTVDTSWFLAGALWSASFLDEPDLVNLADRIYKRVDWYYWARPAESGGAWLIRHGKKPNGRFLPCRWDRANGETVMMYVLAAGAEEGRAIPPSSWTSLRPFYGEVAGHRFNNADLGLFVFQYGLDLLDLRRWRSPDGLDLMAEASEATLANREACLERAGEFRTYRTHWGLSAGDGPGAAPGIDAYRDYSPSQPLDGTAHLTAALVSIAHRPDEVIENVRSAMAGPGPSPSGRYGLSCLNQDRGWVARDMVGIDAGAAVLALENALTDDRVRAAFHGLPCVDRGLERLGFRDASSVRLAS